MLAQRKASTYVFRIDIRPPELLPRCDFQSCIIDPVRVLMFKYVEDCVFRSLIATSVRLFHA